MIDSMCKENCALNVRGKSYPSNHSFSCPNKESKSDHNLDIVIDNALMPMTKFETLSIFSQARV